MRWKRSDISSLTVLAIYARPQSEKWPADEVLARETGAPIKVCWAAMWREDAKGYLDYGINLRGGWLTDAGREKLQKLQGGS